MTLASAIYEGSVRHRRLQPVGHEFTYPLFMMYLDLEEIDRVFRGSWFWSVERLNLASFRRADYMGDPRSSLADTVRERIRRALDFEPRGPIRMLTHLRYFGYCFNPVTFYYCFAPGGESIDAIAAEITNTPWKERHAYILDARAMRQAPAVRFTFSKSFHVSPFMPMDLGYDWSFTAPSDRLFVHMNLERQAAPNTERKMFDATLNLRRREISPASLRRALIRYPLMTASVITNIHWHALRLWLKRIPVVPHPGASSTPPATEATTP